MHPEVPISFSLVIGWDYSIYNVAVTGSPVLCTMSLYLPSLSWYQFIHLGWEEQVRVKCLAQGHNTRAHTGLPTQDSNSQPWDHESGALQLSYVCLIRICISLQQKTTKGCTIWFSGGHGSWGRVKRIFFAAEGGKVFFSFFTPQMDEVLFFSLTGGWIFFIKKLPFRHRISGSGWNFFLPCLRQRSSFFTP